MSNLTDQEIKKALQEPLLKKKSLVPADAYRDLSPAGKGGIPSPNAALSALVVAACPQPQNWG